VVFAENAAPLNANGIEAGFIITQAVKYIAFSRDTA